MDRKMESKIKGAVFEIANEQFSPGIDPEIEKSRLEEEAFNERYNEQGPWIRNTIRTIVKPYSTRRDLEPIVEIEEPMEVEESEELDDFLDIDIPLQDLDLSIGQK